MKENIPSLPCHFVSEQGQVFRKDEYIDGRSGKIFQKRKGSWKKLHISIHTNRKGKYPCPKVHVCVKGITRSLKISRLVAEAYIPNPLNKPCVCHKDNNRTNNRVENLYWGTYKENTQQCIQDGRFKPGGRDILDEFSINCLLYEYNLGKPRSILKKKFGISDSAITRIINLKSKPKFGNYKFKAIYQDIMNDYQEGMLVRDICNKYSIGHTTLNNYLRRLNIVRHR